MHSLHVSPEPRSQLSTMGADFTTFIVLKCFLFKNILKKYFKKINTNILKQFENIKF